MHERCSAKVLSAVRPCSAHARVFVGTLPATSREWLRTRSWTMHWHSRGWSADGVRRGGRDGALPAGTGLHRGRGQLVVGLEERCREGCLRDKIGGNTRWAADVRDGRPLELKQAVGVAVIGGHTRRRRYAVLEECGRGCPSTCRRSGSFWRGHC